MAVKGRTGHGRHMLRLLIGAVSLLGVARPAFATPDPGPLYLAACAACHGPDGRGLAPDDPRLATFDPPPPDLSDPAFSSAEPARDWEQVIRHGGSSLGLSAQ